MNFIQLTALIFIFSVAALAQGGKISGKVTFGADTILHQVSVQIVQLKRTTLTDDNGFYEFNNVPAGRYTVVAHQEGFGDSAKTVVLAAGATATADFQLEISGVKEQVTVTASGTGETAFESIASVSSIGSNEITSRAAVRAEHYPQLFVDRGL